MTKKRGLGRNLEALLGATAEVETQVEVSQPARVEGNLTDLSLSCIEAGAYQPRKAFNEDSIKELADSIRSQGIIQPIVVRTKANNHYEIIAGERRFRAAKLAGLEKIPALVRELPDEAVMAMALIENIQREDLNPIEEAEAIQSLIDKFQMTHQQIANAIGKSRAAVSNLLRLMGLEPEVRDQLESKALEMGHARALLTLEPAKQISAAHTIIEKGLSVRETEDYVRRLQNLIPGEPRKKAIDPLLHDFQKQLSYRLGSKVLIQQNAEGKGKIVIKYKNETELQQLMDKF